MSTPPGINVVTFGNISATPPNFTLDGGRYMAAAVVGAGTVALNVVGPDGSTLLPVADGNLSAGGLTIVEIGKGQECQLTLSGASGVYVSISQIPLSPAA
jgi:hypothetical protein